MLFAFLFFFLTIHISIYIPLLRHIYISISTIFNLDYSSRRLYYCLACSFFRGETLQSEFFVRWMFYNFFLFRFVSFRSREQKCRLWRLLNKYLHWDTWKCYSKHAFTLCIAFLVLSLQNVYCTLRLNCAAFANPFPFNCRRGFRNICNGNLGVSGVNYRNFAPFEKTTSRAAFGWISTREFFFV